MTNIVCRTFVRLTMFWWFVAFFGFSILNIGISQEQRKSLDLNFHQDDYKLRIEWGEIVRYNKRLVKYAAAKVFKYNRTCTATNLTFEYNLHLGKNIEVILQVYKFTRSNEYVQFPLRAQVNFCEAVSKNVMGVLQGLNCGNFTGCPILKNHRIHICNFIPDASRLPPFIPSGRYKMEMQGLFHNEELYLGNFYAEVYRPFVKK